MGKEYEVGYGKPPKKSQFKKGQSGNSKSWPKDSKNTYTLLNEILSQKISITENGKPVQISKRSAALIQLVNKAVKGDLRSINTLLPHMLIVDNKEEDRAKVLLDLDKDDKEIISNYLKSLSDYTGIEGES